MCNCHCILEFYVMFSGVNLSIRSFNFFRIAVRFTVCQSTRLCRSMPVTYFLCVFCKVQLLSSGKDAATPILESVPSQFLPNYDQLENFKRIEKKFEVSSVNPIAAFEHKY